MIDVKSFLTNVLSRIIVGTEDMLHLNSLSSFTCGFESNSDLKAVAFVWPEVTFPFYPVICIALTQFHLKLSSDSKFDKGFV